jgi:hypothetical protein
MFEFCATITDDPANGYAVFEKNKFVLPYLWLMEEQFCNNAFPAAK